MIPKETKQDKKRQLHDINTRIYQIIDDLAEIDAQLGLGYQNLRDATKNIQQAIANLIDQETDKIIESVKL